MEDTSKYLIHADVTADGVVERSDVVGAIFGQTEGLLGDELDLRDLRQSQKVGRIDVEITSRQGTSTGAMTIATSLDKVETATLAASLETITRVGPCRAEIEISEIEDVRAAKRREVVDRAKELLRTGFDDSVMSSEEILREVREYVRVADISEYEGLPAGPHVKDSDAIIVVEGRSDVLTLLKYGIKNAIAVEGTNVPDAVAELTNHRTVTAFLDGDRGGDLILEELAQIGDVDYVAFAPRGTSVEDLDHHQLFTALRKKIPYDEVPDGGVPSDVVAATDGSAEPAPARAIDSFGEAAEPLPDPSPTETTEESTERTETGTGELTDESEPNERLISPAETTARELTESTERAETDDERSDEPNSTYGHVSDVIRDTSGHARFVGDDGEIIEETNATDAYEVLEQLDETPRTIVIDTILEQQLLDLAAERGVERIVAASLGQFTKRPTSVRVHAVEEVSEVDP